MNERLAMIAEHLGESDLEQAIESKLNQLGFAEANLLNKLEDKIDPEGIYNVYDHDGEVSYKKRAKTYLVANRFDERYVLKIADLEEGEVSRLNLCVELGRVRMARLEKELQKIRDRVSKSMDTFNELQLNEIMYGIPCSDRAIKWHQAMFGEPEIEVLPQQVVLFHDWKVDGF